MHGAHFRQIDIITERVTIYATYTYVCEAFSSLDA